VVKELEYAPILDSNFSRHKKRRAERRKEGMTQIIMRLLTIGISDIVAPTNIPTKGIVKFNIAPVQQKTTGITMSTKG
jgi:hypothetical protein